MYINISDCNGAFKHLAIVLCTCDQDIFNSFTTAHLNWAIRFVLIDLGCASFRNKVANYAILHAQELLLKLLLKNSSMAFNKNSAHTHTHTRSRKKKDL